MFWKFMFSKLFVILCFIKVKRIENAQLDPNKTYIFCSNHSSYLDIILSYLILEQPLAFLGKIELEKWLLIGLFFKRKIDISVDRSNYRQSFQSLNIAGERLKKNQSVFIFPEGSIPISTPKMKRFKNGVFKLAIDTQTNIVPITFTLNWKRLSIRNLTSPCLPGIAPCIIHKPIAVTKQTDLETLKTQVFNTINEPLKPFLK